MNEGAAGLSVAQVARLAELPRPEDLVRVVALDGPAGTGKSSVSRQLALALGWRFVDTGATYRAATLAAVRAGVDPGDAGAVVEVVAGSRIRLITDPAAPAILLDGDDVSSDIRSAAVTSRVSAVSALPSVRELLIALQRQSMGTGGAVVEGRDIATVVAPQAGLKVYLDARPEVRAQRRAADPSAQDAQQGSQLQRTEDVGRALALRDSLDSRTNKLQVSEGAVHVDTSDLSLDEVVTALIRLAQEAGLITNPDDRP